MGCCIVGVGWVGGAKAPNPKMGGRCVGCHVCVCVCMVCFALEMVHGGVVVHFCWLHLVGDIVCRWGVAFLGWGGGGGGKSPPTQK